MARNIVAEIADREEELYKERECTTDTERIKEIDVELECLAVDYTLLMNAM